ncbi:MAG: FtsW/RodA/SpoVE family cell cycle protein [Bacteroidales bacterium]|nr:FtsW/RodA/SpoVE family cell cycle protein [Bacteroidales bacterium]
MIATIKKYLKGDPVIWAVLIALTIFSVLAVYSSTGMLAWRYQGGNTSYYFIKHTTVVLVGLLIVFLIHLVPYKFFSRFSQILLLISVPILILTLAFGANINEATRSLKIPGIGITIQTFDIAKLALIMYIARMLSLNQDEKNSNFSSFLWMIGPIVLICGLIMPANLSTAMMLFAACYVLMFIGRVKIKYLATFGALVISGVALLIIIALNSNWEGRWETWRNRIESFTDKENGDNYQVNQSKIAIVSGGIVKLRPGKSIQRNYLPHPYSDFIYAIIIEEYGLLGGVVVMFLYLYLLFRAGVIVRKSTRTFPAFLAMGITVLIVMQAMINMAVAVNIFPVTGQPLPMISMGGTSVLFTCVSLGMLLSVSRGIDQPGESTEKVNEEEQQNNN